MTTLSIFICLTLYLLSNCDGEIYNGYGDFPLRPNDANNYCTLATYDDYNGENLAKICKQISNTKEVCI